MAILFDTTVLVDALRGRPVVDKLRRLRATEDPPFICAITVEELHRGLRLSERGSISAFLDGFRVAPIGRKEGERAGEWRRRFGKQGITLSQPDCLIAAAAVGVGARLATGNPSDFPMLGLDVEHWPVGS